MQDSPKVRVESDGTETGTRVTVDGKTLGNVKSLMFTIGGGYGPATLTLELCDVDLQLSGFHCHDTHEVNMQHHLQRRANQEK